MALKPFVETLEELPEYLRTEYKETEKDGKKIFVLDGFVPKSVHDEFRSTNIKLLKEQEDAKKELARLSEVASKYKDLDPEKAREALKKIEELEEKHRLDAGKIDEVIAERTEKMRKEADARQAELTKKLDDTDKVAAALKAELHQHKVNAALDTALSGIGILKPGAKELALEKGSRAFTMDDAGNVVAVGDGPKTPKEWAEAFAKSHEYLFEPSGGGGSGGGKKGAPASGKLSQEELSKLSPAEKMKLHRENQAKK